VRQDCVDFRGSGLQQLFGRVADGAAGVRHVVNLKSKMFFKDFSLIIGRQIVFTLQCFF
jgi:hypothetical protein